MAAVVHVKSNTDRCSARLKCMDSHPAILIIPIMKNALLTEKRPLWRVFKGSVCRVESGQLDGY